MCHLGAIVVIAHLSVSPCLTAALLPIFTGAKIWKSRWVVLKKGYMSYWENEAARSKKVRDESNSVRSSRRGMIVDSLEFPRCPSLFPTH